MMQWSMCNTTARSQSWIYKFRQMLITVESTWNDDDNFYMLMHESNRNYSAFEEIIQSIISWDYCQGIEAIQYTKYQRLLNIANNRPRIAWKSLSLFKVRWLAKFFTSQHYFGIELGRWKGQSRSERECTFCKTIDDEEHRISTCILHNISRAEWEEDITKMHLHKSTCFNHRTIESVLNAVSIQPWDHGSWKRLTNLHADYVRSIVSQARSTYWRANLHPSDTLQARTDEGFFTLNLHDLVHSSFSLQQP
jgi:hypothetical protein